MNPPTQSTPDKEKDNSPFTKDESKVMYFIGFWMSLFKIQDDVIYNDTMDRNYIIQPGKVFFYPDAPSFISNVVFTNPVFIKAFAYANEKVIREFLKFQDVFIKERLFGSFTSIFFIAMEFLLNKDSMDKFMKMKGTTTWYTEAIAKTSQKDKSEHYVDAVMKCYNYNVVNVCRSIYIVNKVTFYIRYKLDFDNLDPLFFYENKELFIDEVLEKDPNMKMTWSENIKYFYFFEKIDTAEARNSLTPVDNFLLSVFKRKLVEMQRENTFKRFRTVENDDKKKRKLQ